MKVSILIPVYGVERYIAECAHSLMGQTYEDIEYIFVNDCTQDRSIDVLRQVLEQYPERASQVTIIDHEQNRGLAGARQTALNAATGEAVLIVDSDDYVALSAVQQLVDAMRSSQADVVDGGYATVTCGKASQAIKPLHVSLEKYLKTILCQNVEPNRIWGRLIRRSLFIDNAIAFTPGVDYGEDFSVLPRLLAHASRHWTDSCLYYYRDDNPDSYSNNISSAGAISFFRSQQIVGEFFTGNDQLSQYRLAAEVGWVNVWRFARRFRVEPQLAEKHFTLKPSRGITKLMTSLMKSHLPFNLVNFFYKAFRRLFLLTTA